MNLLEGGKQTDNGLAFQEYHIVPETDNIKEAVNVGIMIQNTLREIIMKDLGNESVIFGDEGGFAPKTSDIRKPLLYLTEAIRKNNLQDKIHLALDVAASSFYQNDHYEIEGKNISSLELMKIYESLIAEFNLFSIEDPFDEEDFKNFKELKDKNKN
jgi:enolase